MSDIAHALIKCHPDLHAVEGAAKADAIEEAAAGRFAEGAGPANDAGAELEATGAAVEPREDIANIDGVVLASVTMGENGDLLAARDVDYARRGLGFGYHGP